jgi:hypothetical protein
VIVIVTIFDIVQESALAFFFYFSASPFGLANSNSFTMATPDGFVW